ncbi:hypothetical protein GTO10_03500, partial [Candidatus Saccharibacteria bacterium]|nr:hypothetical protein [Candidatus Saccharibacteria bacterium]
MVKDQVEALGIKGLGFINEPRRFYPEKKLAANILGLVAFNESGNDQGYFGLEGYYDGDLKGAAGRVVQEYSALGEPILVGGYNLVQPQNGN